MGMADVTCASAGRSLAAQRLPASSMARAQTEFIPDQLHDLADALLQSAREAADAGDVEAAWELLVKSSAPHRCLPFSW
jgi:hypothetical protein